MSAYETLKWDAQPALGSAEQDIQLGVRKATPAELEKAKEILAKWEEYAPKFRKVVPHPPVSTLPAGQATAAPVAAKA